MEKQIEILPKKIVGCIFKETLKIEPLVDEIQRIKNKQYNRSFESLTQTANFSSTNIPI